MFMVNALTEKGFHYTLINSVQDHGSFVHRLYVHVFQIAPTEKGLHYTLTQSKISKFGIPFVCISNCSHMFVIHHCELVEGVI